MRQITDEQIANILATFYETNLPARQFDIVKGVLNSLPIIKAPETANNTPQPPVPKPLPVNPTPHGRGSNKVQSKETKG